MSSSRKIDLIRKEVWDSYIPVCVRHDENDLVTIIEQPEPCYISVPRNNYFPLVLNEVLEYFRGYINPDVREQPVWLSTEEEAPIKWYLPVGLVYDILMPLAKQGEILKLTLHYQKYPDQLMSCAGNVSVKSHLMSSIKEAESLKHSSRLMNDMTRDQHDMIWRGVEKHSYDEFWNTNKILNDHNKNPFKHLPVKIYSDKGRCIQQLLFITPENSSPEDADEQTDTSKQTTPPLTLDYLLNVSNLDPSTPILCQGISVSNETELLTLYLTMAAPDNFLHLVCKPLT